MRTNKTKRFEVIGTSGAVIGYVYGTDIDHAYAIACEQYHCRFYLVGSGSYNLAEA